MKILLSLFQRSGFSPFSQHSWKSLPLGSNRISSASDRIWGSMLSGPGVNLSLIERNEALTSIQLMSTLYGLELSETPDWNKCFSVSIEFVMLSLISL